MLKKLLETHGISQSDLCRGACLSRSVASRIVAHGIWPQRDTEAPKRLADFLTGRGVDDKSVAAALPKKLAPDVFPHAEAVPAANPMESEQEEVMLLRFESLSPLAKKHFGLARSPFVDDVRTRDDVFASPNTRYVRAALLDAALNHGFLALVGESGAG